MPRTQTKNGQPLVYQSSAPTLTSDDAGAFLSDVNGNLKVSLATKLAGEDQTNDVLKVEERFTSSDIKVVDALIKTGAGFIHTVTFAPNDAAPTAGTISILDSTAAGAGTALFTWVLPATIFNPFTVTLDVSFAVGLYFDFTTTGDVNVVGSYR